MDESIITARGALLQALRSNPRSHAAALIQHVSTVTEGRVRLSDSAVYPTLRELERLGLIEECDNERAPGPRGGKPGKAYALTGLGAQLAESEAGALRRLLRTPRPKRTRTEAP